MSLHGQHFNTYNTRMLMICIMASNDALVSGHTVPIINYLSYCMYVTEKLTVDYCLWSYTCSLDTVAALQQFERSWSCAKICTQTSCKLIFIGTLVHFLQIRDKCLWLQWYIWPEIRHLEPWYKKRQVSTVWAGKKLKISVGWCSN